MKPACFFDRDGVIIEEVNYIADPALVRLCPYAADAIQAVRDAGYEAIIVSNQSGIARGLFTPDDLKAVNARMLELLSLQHTKIDAVYYCCHHPKGAVPEYTGECTCRKPKPGLFLRAAEEHNLELSRSFMIGDKESDLAAGYNAGCGALALVRTGHGAHQKIDLFPNALDSRDVLSAVQGLLQGKGTVIHPV